MNKNFVVSFIVRQSFTLLMRTILLDVQICHPAALLYCQALHEWGSDNKNFNGAHLELLGGKLPNQVVNIYSNGRELTSTHSDQINWLPCSLLISQSMCGAQRRLWAAYAYWPVAWREESELIMWGAILKYRPTTVARLAVFLWRTWKLRRKYTFLLCAGKAASLWCLRALMIW